MAKTAGFLIPEAVIERLRARVKMEDDREIGDFVTDALNTYVALGGLVAGGAELQVRNAADGSVRRVRLPFELRRDSARPDAADAAPEPAGDMLVAGGFCYRMLSRPTGNRS